MSNKGEQYLMINKMQEVLPKSEQYLTQEQMNIIINSQRLWLELAFTIRSLMMAVIRDPERTQSAANRLYNIVEINFYNYLRLFYGPDVAQQLVNYLSNFITNMWRLFEAISTNNTEEMNSSVVKLYENADQASSYLASINIYWNEQQWKDFLYQSIRVTIDEAMALASKDFEKEYQIFNRLADLATLMGDYTARGIISRSAPSSPQQNS
jgi:hypothetical protein